MRAHRQHARGGIRQHHAVAKPDKGHEAEERQRRCRCPARKISSDSADAQRRNRRQPDQHHPVDAERGWKSARTGSCRRNTQARARRRRTQASTGDRPKTCDADKRRAAEIGKERARREGRRQAIAPEPRRAQQFGIFAELLPKRCAALAALVSPRSRQISHTSACPPPARSQKVACQPKVSSSQPPSAGLIIGTTAMPIVT